MERMPDHPLGKESNAAYGVAPSSLGPALRRGQGSGIRGRVLPLHPLEPGCAVSRSPPGVVCPASYRKLLGQGPRGVLLQRPPGSLLTVPILAAVLLLAVLSPGCERKNQGEEAVAWVNGEAIPFSVFWNELKNRYNEVTDTSTPQQDVLQVLKRTVLSDLIRERLLLQEASKRGVTVSDKTLEAGIKAIQDGYAFRPFRRSLTRHGMDYDAWCQALRDQMIMEALFHAVVQEVGEVTDQEISQYYKDHLDEFLHPEAVELQQIVVKDRATAQRLLRRIRQGESFESLAEKHSFGPEREVSGRLGIYRRGNLPEALEKAAFSTPAGKITSPVETGHGFHVLKVVRRIPSHMQSEKEAHDEIARKLSEEKKQVFYDQWIERLVRDSDIRVHASLVQLVEEEEPQPPRPFKNEANRETQ